MKLEEKSLYLTKLTFRKILLGADDMMSSPTGLPGPCDDR